MHLKGLLLNESTETAVSTASTTSDIRTEILTELTKIRKEIEDAKANARFMYAQTDRDLDELRDELSQLRQTVSVKNHQEVSPSNCASNVKEALYGGH